MTMSNEEIPKVVYRMCQGCQVIIDINEEEEVSWHLKNCL